MELFVSTESKDVKKSSGCMGSMHLNITNTLDRTCDCVETTAPAIRAIENDRPSRAQCVKVIHEAGKLVKKYRKIGLSLCHR